MDGNPNGQQGHRDRKKNVLAAFRFIQGGDDREKLCEKIDGECTGRSLHEWQIEEGEYTNICPAALVNGAGHIHTFWKRTKAYGLPGGGGWMEQPNRWMEFLGMCEDEYGKLNAAG